MSGPITFPEPRDWALTVVDVTDRSAALRRIRLAGDGLAELEYLAGQDMAVVVPAADGTTVRRRYTIRSADREGGTVDLDFVMHGDGPAAQWAAAATPGERLDVIAPRGKVTIDPEAAWHLFAGDEVAAPGVAAMVESLDAGARVLAFVEVGEPDDEEDIDVPAGVDAEITWLHRGGAPPGEAGRLIERLAEVPLPEGVGHAYLAGEYSVVHALRRACAERGMTQEQVSPKPYWRLGRQNMPHGEPERN
jgi:NADPH-dependent ferric siderophore reductase